MNCYFGREKKIRNGKRERFWSSQRVFLTWLPASRHLYTGKEALVEASLLTACARCAADTTFSR